MTTHTCAACHTPVKRRDAILRGDLHNQRAWHPGCFTVDRATASIDTAAIIEADTRIGMSLSERLRIARAEANTR